MSSTVLLRSSARCIRRAFMPYCLAESRIRLIPSSIQPLATWTERLKRWSSGNQTEKRSADKNPDEQVTANKAQSDTANEKCDKCSEVIQEKDEKIKDLQDKYLRALAETENIRQRVKKQVEDSKLYSIQEFSKDILNVADILQKATKSVHETSLKQQDNQLNALYDGVKMTEAELHKVLQKHGITQIDPMGQLFDPVFHEAMFEVEGEKPGSIAHVSAIGYTLHGRTIRPAKVGVVRSKLL